MENQKKYAVISKDQLYHPHKSHWEIALQDDDSSVVDLTYVEAKKYLQEIKSTIWMCDGNICGKPWLQIVGMDSRRFTQVSDYGRNIIRRLI